MNKIPATEKMVIAIRTKMMVIRVIREKIVAKVTTVVIVWRRFQLNPETKYQYFFSFRERVTRKLTTNNHERIIVTLPQ